MRGPVGQRGLALIVVLWVVALMTVLGAAYGVSLRTEVRLAAGVVDRARAGAAAEAALRRVFALLMERYRERSELAEQEWQMGFDDIQVQVRAHPENAKVDLNTAPAQLLRGLMSSVSDRLPELDPDRAEAIADAILDWRDPDSRRQPQGAEADDYKAAGRSPGPRDQAFMSISELALVLGMTPAVHEALRPLVTVYSWSPQVDPMSASRDTLLAIPGLDAALVDSFIEARNADIDRRSALAMLRPGARYLARGRTSIYTVAALATTPTGIKAGRRAIVKLSGNRKKPFSILAWFHDTTGEDWSAGPAPQPDSQPDAR